MRKLIQLVPNLGNANTVSHSYAGIFENGDKEQEMFIVLCHDQRFTVYDPEKKSWVEFVKFVKSGP